MKNAVTLLVVILGSFAVVADGQWTDADGNIWSYSEIEAENGTFSRIITGGTFANGYVTIPSEILGLPVTAIRYRAFEQNTSLKGITISDTVTVIGESAFFNCRNMEYVKFGKNLKEINELAFGGCISLTELDIPDSVTYISSTGAFLDCRSVRRLRIGAGITDMSDWNTLSYVNGLIVNGRLWNGNLPLYSPFSWCDAIECVEFGVNVRIININAFSDSVNLTNIICKGTLPEIIGGDSLYFKRVEGERYCNVLRSTYPDALPQATWAGFTVRYLDTPSDCEYSSWAAANGLSGAWDAKDASGVYNVFRYVFNKPVGDFSETPLIGISFVDGKPLIKTPAIVNASGFTLSVAASDKADGTGNVINYTLNASGETRIEEAVKPSRFFRLKVDVAQ